MHMLLCIRVALCASMCVRPGIGRLDTMSHLLLAPRLPLSCMTCSVLLHGLPKCHRVYSLALRKYCCAAMYKFDMLTMCEQGCRTTSTTLLALTMRGKWRLYAIASPRCHGGCNAPASSSACWRCHCLLLCFCFQHCCMLALARAIRPHLYVNITINGLCCNIFLASSGVHKHRLLGRT